MKHFHLSLLLAFLLIPFSSYGYDVLINGVYYNLDKEAYKAIVTYDKNDGKSYSGTVTIPNSIVHSGKTYDVEEIGARAFDGCASLATITLPERLKTIHYEAFRGCSSLQTITIPKSVAIIYRYAFSGCTSLESMFVGDNPAFLCEDEIYPNGCTITSSGMNCTLYVPVGCKERYLYNEYWRESFSKIQERFTAIGVLVGGIFYNLNKDENRASLTYFCAEDGASPYSGSIEVPNSIYYSGTNYNVVSIGDSAFWYCKDLQSVKINRNIIGIGNKAFYGCSGLSEIFLDASIPCALGSSFDGVNSNCICYVPCGYKWLFKKAEGWSRLHYVEETIDESSVYINGIYYNLDRTHHVASVTYGKENDRSYSGSVSIPEEIKKNYYAYSVIAIDSAFQGCELEKLCIPKSVLSIGPEKTFYECRIKRIEVDPENPVYDSRDNCNAIIETATNTLIKGTSRTIIPNTVEIIGQGAFQECWELPGLKIPESVRQIKSGAFCWCEPSYFKFDSRKYLDRRLEIERRAFCDIHELRTITFPDFCDLGQGAFSMFGDRLSTIFVECRWWNNYSNVKFFEDNNSLSWWHEFNSIPRTLYVPYDLDEYYYGREWQNEFDNIEKFVLGDYDPYDQTIYYNEDQIIYINPIDDGIGGQRKTLSIQLQNRGEEVIGFEFSLSPVQVSDYEHEMVHFVLDEKGKPIVRINEELLDPEQFDVQYRLDPQTGNIIFLCYSLDNQPIKGWTGELAQVEIELPSVWGEYPVLIKNQVLSTKSGKIVEYSNVKSSAFVIKYIDGDPNFDGVINVGDITTIAGYILRTKYLDDYGERAADFNKDGNVNVGDITALIDYILNQSVGQAPARMPASDIDVFAEILSDDYEVELGQEFVVPVNVCNSQKAFSGMQFDINLPEGFILKDVVTDSCRMEQFDYCKFGQIEEHTVRTLAFSNENSYVIGEDGAVVYLILEAGNELPDGNYLLSLDNVIFAAGTSFVESPEATINLHLQGTTGIRDVNYVNDTALVYNANGVVVGMADAVNHGIKDLPKGIYFINGKKVLK